MKKSKLIVAFGFFGLVSATSRLEACESLDNDLAMYSQSDKINVVKVFRDPLNTEKIIQHLPTFYRKSTGLVAKPGQLLSFDGIIVINVPQDQLLDGAKTNMLIPYVNGECRADQVWWIPLDDGTKDALIRAIE